MFWRRMAIFALALLGFLRKGYMCTCIGIFCPGKCFGSNIFVNQLLTLNKLLVHTVHSVRVMFFFLQIF